MKNIRESLEQREKEILSPYATLSSNSLGRDIKEDECDIRTVFQRDRDRILHSKSFRRLKDKTQVFLTPEGDHYRTRLTHTLEVSQNARTIAKALQMNEDLVEAIALDAKKIIPCCVYLDGEYGEKDLCIGVPVILGKNGIEKIVEVEFSEAEKAKFAESVAAAREVNSKIAGALE